MNTPLASENVNALWGSFLAETLFRLGLRTAVISPGSRSAPLTCALARHAGICCLPVLDERSAGFLALGIARRSGLPVVLVCTSGTAAANFFPAVIEAREARVPLLVLTADRPPDLRECAAGQTIDQLKLFGQYPRWQVEMAMPASNTAHLRYLRQTLVHAWRRCCYPVSGPVHLNCPFREPLAPVADGSIASIRIDEVAALLPEGAGLLEPLAVVGPEGFRGINEDLAKATRGIIVAGNGVAPTPSGARVVGRIANALGWPVLADVLSGLRDYSHRVPNLVAHYEVLLASGKCPPKPDFVFQLGPLPTSKRLRRWLEEEDVPTLLVDPGDQDLDPLRNRTTSLPVSVEVLADMFPVANENPGPSDYARTWVEMEGRARETVNSSLRKSEALFEGRIPWELAALTSAGTALFFASSMPVRDAEFFWPTGELKRQMYSNRGANGIDGTLSTALGLALQEGETVVAVVGDLAFLHDTNALLSRGLVRGSLTVVLINNDGGGIFENLPVADFDPPFEEFFITPQKVSFERLCSAYEVVYRRVKSWIEFREAIREEHRPGVRVLEIVTDRKRDVVTRREILGALKP